MDDLPVTTVNHPARSEPFWFRSGFRTALWVVFVMWLKGNGEHLGMALRDRDSSEVAVVLSVPIVILSWDTFVGIRNWRLRRAQRAAAMPVPPVQTETVAPVTDER